ncbi:MAG: hypothetical protein IJS41_07715 [Clostridia bacterium]|nr:hypothetical protein [Clostridia bacterium]
MEALEAVLEARRMLDSVTPLKADCGRSCGGACCQPDEDGQGGMLLFPGEDVLYAPLPTGFSICEDSAVLPGMKLLTCSGTCNREDRPLSCRLFPMLPTRNGAKMDWRAWAVCPLMESGKRGLNPAFVEAVKEAGKILYACPEHAAFLDALHDFNERLKEF